ncbi:MAG: ferrochelatase [Bacteroidetes bacterium]|nr:MAG: ferrochelatase [Bacteroidota bacterium]
MKRIGVVLMNMGGPNREEAVQPFLYNLFMDDDIIKIPLKGGIKRRLVKLISSKRARVVAEKYKMINACPKGCLGPKSCSNRQQKVVSDCCSSTNPITEWQRRELEKALNRESQGISYTVVTAMRYWHPFTDEAIDQLEAADCEQLVLLPLYPQFSYSTTASSLNEWVRRLRARGLEDRWKTLLIPSYHTHPAYIAAINQRIDEALQKFPPEVLDQLHLLFSAHGTPVSFREAGDPYSFQIKESMEAVMQARGKDHPYWLSYQSRVGPVKWLKPNTEDFLHVLRGYGVRHLLVIPIAFVSDHIETSHEIGIEFREIAEEIGMQHFELTEGLNDMPLFIDTLRQLVHQRLGEAKQVPGFRA